MFITGLKSEIRYPKCPHCGGLLYVDIDGCEKYLTCLMCARKFDFDMEPKIMTPRMLDSRYGIKLTHAEECASMRIE